MDALDTFPVVVDVFDPGLYNDNELEAIAKLDLGEAPIVLKRDLGLLPDDEAATLGPLIERIFDLVQLEDHRGVAWAGVDAIKEAAAVMQEYRRQFNANKAASGKGFHPSMHTFDSRGRARFGGVGSDNGRVRTYTDDKGRRMPFAVRLTESGGPAQWQFNAPSVEGAWGNVSAVPVEHTIELIVRENESTTIMECPICGHAESYDRDNKGEEDAANHRMSQHLQAPKSELEAHQLLHQEVYT